ASIVEEAGAGKACLPGDAGAIASAVEELYFMPRSRLEEMGEKGRDFYRRQMSRSVSVDKFEAVLEQVVDEGRAD
ncbi:MAG: glycosyltransferase WbuB, partial [Candidatus Geothermincolia bacterium]